MKRSTLIMSFTALVAGLHVSSWASDSKTNNDLLTKSTQKVSRLMDTNYSVVHNFTGADGKMPYAGLIYNESYSVGSFLYGVTTQGGPYNAGTVVKISPDGNQQSILYSFQGGNDGANPYASLTVTPSSDVWSVYGTTQNGGARNYGTVFNITADGKKTSLHSFQGGNDGADPISQLTVATDSNLYGTTLYGGASGIQCTAASGCGTVYYILSSYDNSESVLYSFQGGSDGYAPYGGLILGSDGALYGTTEYGGSGLNCGANGCGTIFKLTLDGTKTTLYNFQGGTDGANPLGSLLQIGDTFYGTTQKGGATNNGTVFTLSQDGNETVLYSFQGYSSKDGATPYSGLIQGPNGDLYGTTAYGGGYNSGVIYELSLDGKEIILYSFSGVDGSNSAAGLALDPSGALYGTTVVGGKSGYGTIFKMSL